MTDDLTPPYATELGHRLREIRQQQGLSLHGVQAKSGDRWKAVVIGSYERGDRSITAHRLAELADFYGVPMARLLPGTDSEQDAPPVRRRLMLDLQELQRRPLEEARPLIRYIATIQDQRGDYNGRVLSIREDDVRSLCLLYDTSPGGLFELLESWNVVANHDGFGRHIAAQREPLTQGSATTVDLSSRGANRAVGWAG
ncbi:MAG TPA: transcriptional regulator [Mycobacteriales bacterium]|nr:transcriptional regulator [Mycobacteriales bacterium]